MDGLKRQNHQWDLNFNPEVSTLIEIKQRMSKSKYNWPIPKVCGNRPLTSLTEGFG